RGLEYARPITIGNNVWIGAQVCVLPGVTIGDDCVIGAGSVVCKDISAGSLAVGNPCRVIRKINC
ncbi:MAG: sugar O-acetyltransferase, partial [Bacteroides sp.]|nr:sugar O-acetyltransferase [Bacteroides sp.]